MGTTVINTQETIPSAQADEELHTHEMLVCLETGDEIADDGLILGNPSAGKQALLRAKYLKQRLDVRADMPGIFRFADWLPVRRILRSGGAPVTYRSEALGEKLGLENLYVTFSGYWPDIGANMMTGTFKECEAYAVLARMPRNAGILVVASAGNTARAFMKAASENDVPMVIVVPEKNLSDIWTVGALNPCVHIIAAGGESDYFDAIRLAGIISEMDGFINEGGAKNVARRDGMGTTVLSAATTIGQIPDVYFQAVGSGTGAIAAHEAALRLNASGDYEKKTMRLIVSQNLPFTPMYDAWRRGSRALAPIDEADAIKQIDEMDAKVLSNRKPPYGLVGGLFDALTASGGDIDAVTNFELRQAQAIFKELEGRDICPEAGAALWSLKVRAERGDIDSDAAVMLNVTGGGIDALKNEVGVTQAMPNLIIDKEDFELDTTKQKIFSLYRRTM